MCETSVAQTADFPMSANGPMRPTIPKSVGHHTRSAAATRLTSRSGLPLNGMSWDSWCC